MELRTTRAVHRLPLASTGNRNGDCFLAAMLAHTLEIDLARNSVPGDEVKELRGLQGVPPGKQYLPGGAQQAVAEYLGGGYIMVDPDSRKANLFTVRGQAPETLQYAMLVLYSHQHTEPLATGAGKKCGLVTHGRAIELLNLWGIEVAPRGGTIEIDE